MINVLTGMLLGAFFLLLCAVATVYGEKIRAIEKEIQEIRIILDEKNAK
jgi:hypothetical protein